jgi:hypothetical protein
VSAREHVAVVAQSAVQRVGALPPRRMSLPVPLASVTGIFISASCFAEFLAVSNLQLHRFH